MSRLTTLDGEIESESISTSIVIRTVWNCPEEKVLLSLDKAEVRNRFHRTKVRFFQATYT